MSTSTSTLTMATRSDGPAIARLLGQPIPGKVAIALETQPDGCAPQSTAVRRHHAVIVRSPDGEVLAHGARTVTRRWWQGQPRWLGYLHGLRRVDALAGDGRRLVQALHHLAATHQPDEADLDLTAISTANVPARRVLEGVARGAPTYHFICDYRTQVLVARTVAPKQDLSITVRTCPDETLATCAAWGAQPRGDGAEVWPAEEDYRHWLTAWRGNQLCGMARLVDRRAERVERVVAYAPAVAWSRHAINLLSYWRGRPMLPPPGSKVDLLFAAGLTVPDDDPVIVRALLAGLARATLARGATRLVIGMSAQRSARYRLDRWPSWTWDSRLYAVGNALSALPASAEPEAAWL